MRNSPSGWSYVVSCRKAKPNSVSKAALNKLVELGIERQMEAVRSAPPISMSKAEDEPPPVTTAEKQRAQRRSRPGQRRQLRERTAARADHDESSAM